MRQRREQQMHHERMNKPASKKQFEEVWEEDDGLKDETFDPKTFFFLHGEIIPLFQLLLKTSDVHVIVHVSSSIRY